MNRELSNAAAPRPAASVIEANLQNFMQEVIQASLKLPVLVYFTASWCQPCKQYGPVLEKFVLSAQGRLRLARVDIDKNPQLAQQFRVQSVPMVFVFLEGQPVDAFQGAHTEAQLKQLLAPLLGESEEEAEAQATIEAAQGLLEEGKPAEAEPVFRQILAAMPEQVAAIAGLARALLAQGKLEAARDALLQVPPAQKNDEAVLSAQAALGIAESVSFARDEPALRAQLAGDPNNPQALYDLAGILYVSNKPEEAIDALLQVMRTERDWNEKAAQTRLLAFFEALGLTHPLSLQGRRKLSSLLFS
jgi:putative thioredoxin